MIAGIGADLVDVRRIEAALARRGTAFAARLLSHAEAAFHERAPDPARDLAKRFAAKEAFAKACGTGLRHPVTLTQITLTRDMLGKPNLDFAPPLARWLAERGIARAHLTLSDEGSLVQAFVVLETA